MPKVAKGINDCLAAIGIDNNRSKACAILKRKLTSANTGQFYPLNHAGTRCDDEGNSFGSSDVWVVRWMSAKAGAEQFQHHDTNRPLNVMISAKASLCLDDAVQISIFSSLNTTH